MKKITLLLCVAGMLAATSCNDWLNVRPREQFAADEMFESYAGFRDILNGCYIKLKERALYGEKLTMSDIEELAALWREPTEAARPGAYELRAFNYSGDNARATVAAIYSGLYNVIANANMIINHAGAGEGVFPDEATRAVVVGEAHAIRAFCHFDVLRLFGQAPGNTTRQVSLPYAGQVSIVELPPYYARDQFVARVEADLARAEELLEGNDPLFTYTFAELNASTAEDAFMNYRQGRFNYWAVRGIRARFHLYNGEREKAYQVASEIIRARGADGNPLITLSGSNDITAGYLGCPSECLLMLNAHDLTTYAPEIFALGSYAVTDMHCALSREQLVTLFDGQNIASNNRYLHLWEKTSGTPMGIVMPTLKKYLTELDIYSQSASRQMTKQQVIPLLRLSEIYLIVMETTGDLAEANALWATYQLAHNVLVTGDYFTSASDVRPKIVDEYRRELIGEGQMFYTYKRLNATSMLWRAGEVAGDNYIIPLPETEFDPNL
ncbi:MAG: RagB/SusD family nutrient uptake outer membrane protein [Odoribacteraceae bacterium]|jgi:hypothetical protein|nr:RagB/SusD family nutrient uptake outer membrane protein [Odoribacteraceae bacterium]